MEILTFLHFKVFMQMLTFLHLLIDSGKRASDPFIEPRYLFSFATYRQLIEVPSFE